MQAMVIYYDKVWYDDKSMPNLSSITNLINKYRVTYDSHQDYAFNFHNNKGIIKFKRNKQGLYVFKNTYTTENSNVVTTMEEKMVRFTSRQIDKSKLASKV